MASDTTTHGVRNAWTEAEHYPMPEGMDRLLRAVKAGQMAIAESLDVLYDEMTEELSLIREDLDWMKTRAEDADG